MKVIPLYSGRKDKQVVSAYALVDDVDFPRVNAHKWYLMKLYHCKTDIQYARRYEYTKGAKAPKAILLHRFVMGATERATEVDHIDHNGLNCQKNNLRFSSHAENMAHRRAASGCKSKYLGVHKAKSTWACSTQHLGEIVSMKFTTEKEAAIAYNYLAHFNKGSFANLNDIYAS